MRKAFLTAIFIAFVSPAYAIDSGDAAFEILSKFDAEKSKTNYIKLQTSISFRDAEAIDAKFSEIYGDPEISRAGLKVWEVENNSGSRAKKTTIMCGPDGKGGILISVDRRGPKAVGANSCSKAAQAERQAERKTTQQARQNRTRSIERD